MLNPIKTKLCSHKKNTRYLFD